MEAVKRQKLKQLVEIYAMRTRRSLDAIAVLDRHVTSQRSIDEVMAEIRNLSGLVERAAADLFAFVGEPPEKSGTA